MQNSLRRTSALSAAVVSLSLLTLSPLSAATATFVTPAGATVGGLPVSATANFTTGFNVIAVGLTNPQPNITDVSQALSGLIFMYSGAPLGFGSLLGSAGMERAVNADGSILFGLSVATGWAIAPTPNPVRLDALGVGGVGPTHTIIGPPGPGGLYSNANSTIAGNASNNPFLGEAAVFVISLAGITPDTLITAAIFSFGLSGTTIAGVPPPAPAVPLPAPLPLFLTGLGALGLLGWRLSFLFHVPLRGLFALHGSGERQALWLRSESAAQFPPREGAIENYTTLCFVPVTN